MADDVFASQSAMLHLSYYIVQITVYRPFIPIVRGPNAPHTQPPCLPLGDKPDISTTALSICASAAKAGTLILEVLLQRGHSRHTVLVHYAFLYAGVMLVSLWTQIAKEAAHWKRSAQEDEDDKPKPHGKQIDELLKVVAMLDSMRPRWELAREAW